MLCISRQWYKAAIYFIEENELFLVKITIDFWIRIAYIVSRKADAILLVWLTPKIRNKSRTYGSEVGRHR